MSVNPYVVSLRTQGYFTIDFFDGDKFICVVVANIKPHSFAELIANKLNEAFNHGLNIGQTNCE